MTESVAMIKRTLSAKGERDRRAREAGLSAVEYVVALVFIMVALVGWLQLTSTTIQNGTFVRNLADVGWLASAKATELSRGAEAIVAGIPKGQSSIGSVAPYVPVQGYFDLLNGSGEVIGVSAQPGSIPKFTRQWLIVKDKPSNSDITICVSVSCNDTHEVIRLVKEVKAEALSGE